MSNRPRRNPSLLPVLRRELRTQLRGGRAGVLLSLFVGLLLLTLLLLYRAMPGRANFGAPLATAEIGQALFIGLVLAMQTLIVFLAPAATLDVISREHEHDTLDMLLVSPLSPAGLLWGKLLGALAFVGLLLFASLPLFALVLVFGGIGWLDAGRVFVTVVVSAVTGAMVGLFCSAVTRQTFTATMLCYALLVSVIGGSLFAVSLRGAVSTGPRVPPPTGAIVANPLSAIASTLTVITPPQNNGSTLRPVTILGLLARGSFERGNGERLVSLPLYRATWVLYSAVTLGLYWVCTHLVRQRRRWRVMRSDVVIMGVVIAFVVIVWLTRAWWLQGLVSPLDAATG